MSTCEVKVNAKVKGRPALKRRVLILSLLIPLVMCHVNRRSPNAHRCFIRVAVLVGNVQCQMARGDRGPPQLKFSSGMSLGILFRVDPSDCSRGSLSPQVVCPGHVGSPLNFRGSELAGVSTRSRYCHRLGSGYQCRTAGQVVSCWSVQLTISVEYATRHT